MRPTHKSVFYWSGSTDRAGFWHGGVFRLEREWRNVQKWGYFPLELFRKLYRDLDKKLSYRRMTARCVVSVGEGPSRLGLIIIAYAMHNTRTWFISAACEMFHTPSLMSKRTSRILDEGGWRRGRGLRLQRYSGVSAEHKFNTQCTGENAQFTSWIAVLVRSVNSMQLCCCLISKFVDVLKWHTSFNYIADTS